MPDVNDLKSWTREEVREFLGDLNARDERFERIEETRKKVFARCKWPELLEKYAGKYVGAYDGEIRAVANSMRELLAQAQEVGVPEGELTWRRIDSAPRRRPGARNFADPER